MSVPLHPRTRQPLLFILSLDSSQKPNKCGHFVYTTSVLNVKTAMIQSYNLIQNPVLTLSHFFYDPL